MQIANTVENIRAMASDPEVKRLSDATVARTVRYKYSYNFTWMGRPIIQFPADVLALQELIWEIKPRVVIETGVAHGGSSIFYASMLELLKGDGRVIGVDVEIRPHNRAAVESHPMAGRIDLVEGSSTDEKTLARVKQLAAGRSPCMVVLDSMHTHDHVLRELELYGPLVTPGSALVVLDTIISDLPGDLYPDRPWSPTDNPRTAVEQFVKTHPEFVQDRDMAGKLLMTSAPGGFLRKVRA